MTTGSRVRVRIKAALLIAALNISASALAWGPEGHRAVGSVADKLLHAHARTQVSSLIGMTLSSASTWADCVKDVRVGPTGAHYVPTPMYHASCKQFETPAGIAAMEDYVSRNAKNCNQSASTEICHKQYHYTDVATQHDHYDTHFVGTSDHDVVAAIGAAIAVLRGNPVPAPFSIKDKREALLMLAHLVGDIHQPLHVGAVYLTGAGQEIDPDTMSPFDPKTETRGGNSIDDGSANLHSEWDAIKSKVTSSHLTLLVKQARAVVASAGSTDLWPALWATDTVVQSHQAFAGLSFAPESAKPGHWAVSFANRTSYLATKKSVQERQLAVAGARLAQLLNAVWP